MANIDKNLASGTNNTTTLNSILTVGSGRNVTIYGCIFTNLTANIITVSVYLNDGTDRLLDTVKIPGGSGVAFDVRRMKGVTLDANEIVKIQSTSTNSFNYKINGSERS